MNWGGWSEFWAMGGKGFYVWGSYALTFSALAIEVYLLRRRAREAKA
jgi:heme exporter protein D